MRGRRELDEAAAEPVSAPDGGTATVKRAALSVVLTWLLPGLGHFYLGRRRRAALYGFIILLMFVLGLCLDGSLSTWVEGSYLSGLATVADLGAGPVYVVAQLTGAAAGEVTSATHEIGNAFHWSAGVMNMLLMLDAADIATGRK